jgi:SAM-dependent methyltransferase
MIVEFDDVMREYWDQSHETRNGLSLTDASLEDHLRFLQVDLPESGSVLCVGVGTGRWVEEIALGTHLDVWALDISPAAQVPLCVPLVTSPEMLPVSWFDLALSHWVSPHVDDAGMDRQICGVIRSMKKGGLFTVHYNEPMPGRSVSDDPVHLGRAGEITMTRDRFTQIVDKAGGTSVIVSETECIAYQMKMVVAHCRSKR